MHDHNHTHYNEDVKNIRVAFFLNLLFTVIEIVGGILTNSVAILSGRQLFTGLVVVLSENCQTSAYQELHLRL